MKLFSGDKVGEVNYNILRTLNKDSLWLLTYFWRRILKECSCSKASIIFENLKPNFTFFCFSHRNLSLGGGLILLVFVEQVFMTEIDFITRTTTTVRIANETGDEIVQLSYSKQVVWIIYISFYKKLWQRERNTIKFETWYILIWLKYLTTLWWICFKLLLSKGLL
jgi:hypothetical protein